MLPSASDAIVYVDVVPDMATNVMCMCHRGVVRGQEGTPRGGRGSYRGTETCRVWERVPEQLICWTGRPSARVYRRSFAELCSFSLLFAHADAFNASFYNRNMLQPAVARCFGDPAHIDCSHVHITFC